MEKNTPENKTRASEITGVFYFLIEYDRYIAENVVMHPTYCIAELAASFADRKEYIQCGQNIQAFRNILSSYPEYYLQALNSFIEENYKKIGKVNCFQIFNFLITQIGVIREDARLQIKNFTEKEGVHEIAKVINNVRDDEGVFISENDKEWHKYQGRKITGPIVMYIQSAHEGESQPEATIEHIYHSASGIH